MLHVQVGTYCAAIMLLACSHDLEVQHSGSGQNVDEVYLPCWMKEVIIEEGPRGGDICLIFH